MRRVKEFKLSFDFTLCPIAKKMMFSAKNCTTHGEKIYLCLKQGLLNELKDFDPLLNFSFTPNKDFIEGALNITRSKLIMIIHYLEVMQKFETLD